MDRNSCPQHVIGPLGERLTLRDLPPAGARWVPRRKAEVLAAVQGGLLTVDQACSRYALTVEEFVSWQLAVERAGLPGLRVTKIQGYKKPQRHQPDLGQ